jgi:CBS domain-containing protein
MTAVADVMTRGVRSMTPEDPLIKAAQAMEELNVGAIVVRGVARERDPRLCRLGDIMSEHVRTVRESDDVEEVLSEMASAKIRRMPVVDHQDHLVGIITLGDIAAKIPDEQEEVGESLAEISTPAQPAHAHLPG